MINFCDDHFFKSPDNSDGSYQANGLWFVEDGTYEL